LRVAIAGSVDQIELVIADTGIGIPDSAVAHIFEPFFSTKEKESGVGLGLSIVFGIVQSHAGTIEVKSGPGRGTTFTVKLPRRAAAQALNPGTV
jgi:two-component system NtrC family sensor kinase